MRTIRWISPFHARAIGGRSYNNIVLKPLTDRKIQKYMEQGFYSAEFRQARRDLAAKKSKARRQGAFIEVEGRLIYSPL